MTTPKLQRHTSELEGRIVPAVYNVTSLSDSGLGSIRQAVFDANNNAGVDTIQIQPGLTGTATLTTGSLVISDPVVIQGTGTPSTKLFVITTNFSGRTLVVNAATTLIGIACSSGTATGAESPGLGGGILATAALTMIDGGCATNSATDKGGAIYQSAGSLTLIRCRFDGNSANNKGGVIYSTGEVSIQQCVFDSNGVSASSGGTIYQAAGSLALENVSIRGGTGKFGAGVYSAVPLMATNCTFEGNGSAVSGAQGGALYLPAGGTLWNCTVAYNGFTSNPGTGGGIFGNVTLESTIVSNNSASTAPDVSGSVTAKFSAIGSASGITTYTNLGGNLAFGTDLKFSSPISAAYGGIANTLPVFADSPIKDKGSNPANLLYDGRGETYPRSVYDAPDIGAFEIQPPPTVIVQLNEGMDPVQRSRVTMLSVTYHRGTMIIGTSRELRRVSDNQLVTLEPVPGTQTDTSITFRAGFSGALVQNGSLIDGLYRLTLIASKIVDPSGQQLDGNGDGTGGDDYVSPTTPGAPGRIHRLFGDINGDATVDLNDFAVFREANGSDSTSLNWNWAFDANGDGRIDLLDFLQFRQRIGVVI